MMVHLPWRRELGGARIQIELAEEFQKLGHRVEKFSYEDAFPGPQSKFVQLTYNFSVKAKEFVKKNAHRFDIIDANQIDLPFSRKELGFNGLLVVRSAGLVPLYCRALKLYKLKDDEWSIKRLLGEIIQYPAVMRRNRSVLPTLKAADLIIVPNRDELAYINNIMGNESRCMCLPFGLSNERYREFAQAAGPVSERLKNKEVVFIGYWSPRKGSRDWGKIVRLTLAKLPQARFKFLGTGVPEKKVFRDLNLPPSGNIKIIPRFTSEELPGLLSEATVGAFPTYIEGFGFAVLEKLAAGLPTVTYDVPGPREMIRHLDSAWMVPPGDTGGFACQLAKLLQLDEEEYFRLSQDCTRVARMFLWERIAKDTLSSYRSFMEKQK